MTDHSDLTPISQLSDVEIIPKNPFPNNQEDSSQYFESEIDRILAEQQSQSMLDEETISIHEVLVQFNQMNKQKQDKYFDSLVSRILNHASYHQTIILVLVWRLIRN